MRNSVTISGAKAKEIADCFGWPSKNPVFEFTNTDGILFGSYESGLDYDIDGYTFEWEWRIM